MHGFRDNKVLLQDGFEVIVILRQGALHAWFTDISRISYRFEVIRHFIVAGNAHSDPF